jgi:hypothetical protein
MMSRMKNMFSFTAHTLRRFLSAGSTRSDFYRQDFMMSAFLHQETTNAIFKFKTLFYSMNRRAVIQLK